MQRKLSKEEASGQPSDALFWRTSGGIDPPTPDPRLEVSHLPRSNTPLSIGPPAITSQEVRLYIGGHGNTLRSDRCWLRHLFKHTYHPSAYPRVRGSMYFWGSPRATTNLGRASGTMKYSIWAEYATKLKPKRNYAVHVMRVDQVLCQRTRRIHAEAGEAKIELADEGPLAVSLWQDDSLSPPDWTSHKLPGSVIASILSHLR